MPINADADRLSLDEEFFHLNFDLGATPTEDGVIPTFVGTGGGAVTFDADATGFAMFPQVSGEAPIFSLTADGDQVLSFDPLDVHVTVQSGQWALLITATTAAGEVQREIELSAGQHQVGFAEGEVDDATAISFTLHPLVDGASFGDVRFHSIAASEVTHGEGHEPDGDPSFDDGDPSFDGSDPSFDDGSPDQPTADDGSTADDQPTADDGSTVEDESHDSGPELVSLAARVEGELLQVSVGLDAAGAFKVLALPADQILDSAEDFDTAFAAGLGAGTGEIAEPGVATIAVQLTGLDASALRLWAVAFDPAGGEYENAATFLLPENGMGGGGLLELEPGDAPFTATLELNAPAPDAVTATVGLFATDRSDGADPLATAIVVIGVDGTQAPVVFEGFDPTVAGAEWYTAEVISVEGPAALDVEDMELAFNAEGTAQTDDHDDDGPTDAPQDDGTQDGDPTGATGDDVDGDAHDGVDDDSHDGADDGDAHEDDSSPEILSFAATAGEGPVSDGVVTFEIAFDWAVSGIDADNFTPTLNGRPAGDAVVGTPVTDDGGYTWSVEVEAPEGEYKLELDFVIDAGISALSPTGETAQGPEVPEAIAEAELRMDRAGPDIRTAFVKGDELHIAFDEATGEVDPAAFAVTAGDDTLTIISVATPREGAAIFTLSRAVAADEPVTLAHSGGGAEDALGNAAAAFDAVSVKNLARPAHGLDDDDTDEAEGDFDIDDDGALVGRFELAGGGDVGPVRFSGSAGSVRVTPPADVSVAATVSTPVGDADARAGAASALIDMSAGFSGRGARRVSNEARELEDGREMSVMQLSPTKSGEGTGRLELAVDRDPGVMSMVGVDTSGLGDDAQISIADADLLQVSGKADVELSGVTTAVMDRASQTVTVSATVNTDPVALFAGGGWDQVTLSGLTGRTRVDLGAGKDVIVSTGYSSDEVFGGLGDDEIRSGRGRDLIRAGQGDDVGFGEGGADRMFGGGGADQLDGGAGSDEIRGGVDNDVIAGGDDDDRLWGGAGDDEASGDAGEDRLFGGGGDDLIFGGEGDDYLDGQIGADQLDGGDGADELRGGSGDDTLQGDAGEDELRGGGGADRLDGGADADDLRGGDGADTFVFSAGSGEDVVRDFEAGIDLIEAAAFADWTAAQQAMTDTEDGVLLSFGDGDQALLMGVSTADLDESSFLFA